MPLLKKRSYQRHSEPKLFQCTGYGDCNMVFTRSEHLLRHARKHTGEKPFKCAVPGCERTFSRFDNMIQHTSTHNKNHDRKRGGNKKSTKKSSTSKQSDDVMSSRATLMTPTTGRPRNSPPLLAPLASPIQKDTSSSSSSPPLPHISLPVSLVPDWKPSSRLASISTDYFTPIHPTFLPSPKELGLNVNLPTSPISMTSAEYNHSMDSNDDSYWSPPPLSPPSTTTSTTTSTTNLSPWPRPTRKLSNVELDLPIHDLSISHGVGHSGVRVSGDEFEALQAISQLSSSAAAADHHHHQHHPSIKSRRSSLSCGAGIGSQVNSFRQHLELAHESNSRLSLSI